MRMKTMSSALKRFRRKNKISQRKLARTLGFTTGQYISNIERGATDCNHYSLCMRLMDIDDSPETVNDMVDVMFNMFADKISKMSVNRNVRRVINKRLSR
jgi:predicted transcriptional regulator